MKGIVYKLFCRNSSITEFYIGSTIDFKARKYDHKKRCNNSKYKQYNYKVYRYIRNNGGFDNWDFEILLQVEVENEKELRLNYEAKYQLDLKPELNDRIEGRTKKEWYIDNKQKILQTRKEYYEDHKEELSEYQKEYRENNKEKIRQTQKEYREDHKEKFDCECGGKYTKINKTIHIKTKKHKDFTLSLSL